MSNYYAVTRSDSKTDELKHFKYIRRVKKNGKWRYYYDESSNKLKNLEKEVMRNDYQYNKNFSKFYNNRYNMDLKTANNPTEKRNVNRWYKDPEIREHTKNAYSSYGQPGSLDKKNLDYSKWDKEKRSRSIGGKVDKFMSKNGHKIAKSMNKSTKTIERGQRKVVNMFKNIVRGK